MLKSYYSLDEAAEFLFSANAGKPISNADVLDLAARNKIRLCFWISESVFVYDDHPLELIDAGGGGYDFRGYARIPIRAISPVDASFEFETFTEIVEAVESFFIPYRSTRDEDIRELQLKLSRPLVYGLAGGVVHPDTGAYTPGRKVLKLSPQDVFVPAVDLLQIAEGGPAPFFDADSKDYPHLLHIAVRAWEWAKEAKSGTPKQRVQAFLTERYPALSQGAKDAIAQVVNWNRTGGRPTDSDETRG